MPPRSSRFLFAVSPDRAAGLATTKCTSGWRRESGSRRHGAARTYGSTSTGRPSTREQVRRFWPVNCVGSPHDSSLGGRAASPDYLRLCATDHAACPHTGNIDLDSRGSPGPRVLLWAGLRRKIGGKWDPIRQERHGGRSSHLCVRNRCSSHQSRQQSSGRRPRGGSRTGQRPACRRRGDRPVVGGGLEPRIPAPGTHSCPPGSVAMGRVTSFVHHNQYFKAIASRG